MSDTDHASVSPAGEVTPPRPRGATLTKQRRRILLAIEALLADGEAVTQSSIGRRIGVAESIVRFHIRRMKADGLVTADLPRHDTIRITEQGSAMVRSADPNRLPLRA